MYNLEGINIGDGAVIGTNSVVTKNILTYAIAVGNPAKVVNFRFDEKKIKELLEIKWWNWNRKKIVNNRDFFTSDEWKNNNNITQ